MWALNSRCCLRDDSVRQVSDSSSFTTSLTQPDSQASISGCGTSVLKAQLLQFAAAFPCRGMNFSEASPSVPPP